MFYKTEAKDHIRVPPELFDLSREDAIEQCIKKKYEGYISEEVGIVIDLFKVNEIGEGIIIAGDGASYYETTFELFTFKPELHEVAFGRIKDIADFGAFMNIGPIEGMIHISQTMDDFVSFSKDKVLVGKENKRTLKVGDKCKARIIAVSFKDLSNPKLGLTMRQPYLGKTEWIEEENEKKEEKPAKKEKK
jgi:DNA-directed RNA polymerase subunit E'|tara:strand:- start:129 stop:701 length:573 start_codon:yes stop_codon:yes gene_type:complete